MPDGYLSIDHGQVKLGGQLVPGIFLSMDISGAVRFDTAEVDNLSGKKKIPMGWEDSLISIELSLTTDELSTCYEKLAEINSIFKGLDNKSNPKIYNIINAHVVARGVDQVVFKGLRSRETNENDLITVALEFDEHNPPTIPPEIRSSGAGASSSAPGVSNTESATVDSNVTADTDSPFVAGFKDGVS